MSDALGESDDPHAAADIRALRRSFLVGAVIGGLWGSCRYGFFSMQNVAMVGLGIITLVALHALWVGISPSRP